MVKGKKIKSPRGHRPSTYAGGIEESAGGRHHSKDQKSDARLFHAAAKIFALKGYDGTSVKELAEVAGVNISLISYHFGGKEGLYTACIRSFGESTLDSVKRILGPASSAEELEIKLMLLIEYLIDAFVKEPDLALLALREADIETPFVQETFKNTFLEIFKTSITFMVDGKNKGFIKDDLDPQTVISLIFGGVSHFIRLNKIAVKYFGRTVADPQFKARVLDHFRQLLVNPIKKS